MTDQERRFTPRERRERARRGFILRVFLLLTLTSGVAYAAWWAPWAQPTPSVPVEVVR